MRGSLLTGKTNVIDYFSPKVDRNDALENNGFPIY